MPLVSPKRLDEILSGFSGKRILVIGDLMLYHYLWGNIQRISPEAPVPVVEVQSETHRPGGAANVIHNLNAVGAEVSAIGIVGDDNNGHTPLAENMALEKFTVSVADTTVAMGQILEPGAKKIHVSETVTCNSTPQGDSMNAEFIRDGKVVKTFKGRGTLKIAYTDDAGSFNRMHYFRLDVRAPNQTRLLSNPIFICPDTSS